MDCLRILPIQYDITWNDKGANFKTVSAILSKNKGLYDIAILPEAFSTGFDMPNSRNLAETMDGQTIRFLRTESQKNSAAIIGSFLCLTDASSSTIVNRGFFITPDQSIKIYDKRHLFSMGGEDRYFTPGNKRLIVEYKGWKICLMICYDLRFPVWSRNQQKEYDLLIYIANWPEVRKDPWLKLLFARAIENSAYVVGLNRIGNDGHGVAHSGNSVVIDYKGKLIKQLPEQTESAEIVELGLSELRNFQNKFPVDKDSDLFNLL